MRSGKASCGVGPKIRPYETGNGHVNGSLTVNRNSILDRKGRRWQVPYLPIDPTDIGVDLTNIICINSQCGKSGILWMLEHTLGLHPPKELAIIYSQTIKHMSIEEKRELAADELCRVFLDSYHEVGFCDRGTARMCHARDHNVVSIDITDMEKRITKEMGEEDDAVVQGITAELSRALGIPLSCGQYSSHVVEKTAEFAAFVRCAMDDGGVSRDLWGVGLGPDRSMAYISAVLSSVTVGAFIIPSLFTNLFGLEMKVFSFFLSFFLTTVQTSKVFNLVKSSGTLNGISNGISNGTSNGTLDSKTVSGEMLEAKTESV
jgi:hypothetical protein